jgi:hypothetical protein
MAAVGTIVGAGVVAAPAVAAGADAVPRSAVELAGCAVELAATPHPADVTARQAPAIAARTCRCQTWISPRTSILLRRWLSRMVAPDGQDELQADRPSGNLHNLPDNL